MDKSPPKLNTDGKRLSIPGISPLLDILSPSPAQEEVLEKLDLANLWQWILCFSVVNFDLEFGHSIKHLIKHWKQLFLQFPSRTWKNAPCVEQLSRTQILLTIRAIAYFLFECEMVISLKVSISSKLKAVLLLSRKN
jgi:hypothetical protein